MVGWLKFVMTLATAFVLMLAIRALAFSVYTVPGNGLAPLYIGGDRILVNRWSYGLRVSSGRLLPYGRIRRQPVSRGDIVAFEAPGDSLAGVFICRCRAIPGDTLALVGGPAIVPGRQNCAQADYYWMEAISKNCPVDSRHLGFIPEQCIIGRVVAILYNHDERRGLLHGYRKDRLLR